MTLSTTELLLKDEFDSDPGASALNAGFADLVTKGLLESSFLGALAIDSFEEFEGALPQIFPAPDLD